MSKTFPREIDKISMLVFPRFLLVFSRFRVFLSDGSSKALQKNVLKKIVSKSFYKKIDQNSYKTIFLDFLFWAFLGEVPRKPIKYMSGSVGFFLSAPCRECKPLSPPPHFVRERPGGQDPFIMYVRPPLCLSLITHTHKKRKKRGRTGGCFFGGASL
jgi:hypothetical protein